MKEKISITLNKTILKKADLLIDRIVIRNRSQAIEFLLKESLDKKRTAVILLGGPEKSIQFDKTNTPFFKVNGIPIIEKAVIKLREEGFKDIIIISRKIIIDLIFSLLQDGSKQGIRIKYLEVKETHGPADSLRIAKKELTSSFLVVYGDIVFDAIKLNELWNYHVGKSPIATLTLTTFKKPSIKGAVFMEGDKIVSFNQKSNKISSYLVFSPIFVCEPEILNYHGHSLEEDIFPVIAKKGLLNGYLSKNRETHIHVKNGKIQEI